MMPPNQWKAEASPLYAFYGMGLQGWDVVYNFTASKPWMRSGWPGLGKYVTETPHYLGQFPALAFAVHKGHIREGELAAARRLTEAQVFRGNDPFSQTLIGVGYPGETDLQTPNEVMAIGRVTADIGGTNTSYRLPWTNYWDQAAGTIRSTTGDLFWDYSNTFVEVRSPKTQGVIGWVGGMTNELPDVTVAATTPFCVILFTPLDDRALRLSEHILVTTMARDRQWHAEYNADGSQLNKVGGPPLFLEPVQAFLTFKGTDILSARVVDLYGVPTTQFVERAGNTITIDGRYQAYYFEVKREPFPQPEISSAGFSNAVLRLSFNSLVPDTSYAVQRGTALLESAFMDITNILPGRSFDTWADVAAGGFQEAYYRLRWGE